MYLWKLYVANTIVYHLIQCSCQPTKVYWLLLTEK